MQMSSSEREELLNQIDFSRVNEETIAACKTNKLIPQQLITDAALAVCKKLRTQLEDTHRRLQAIEQPSSRVRTSYTSSSSRYIFVLINHCSSFVFRRVSNTTFGSITSFTDTYSRSCTK